jgi:methylated-DNA-protein-cysteine methyltransferase-like protein
VSGGFFDKVYGLVCLIPPGRVATYGHIATLLGQPRAARTVGWALHSLSEEQARVVPWQRVIGARGRITHAGGGGGGGQQRRMLEDEGVEFGPHGSVDMERFGWRGPSLLELDRLLGAHAAAQARP